jgi:hypothetical protein
MTGLERYLNESGWVMTHGGVLSTMGHVARRWKKEDRVIEIGLMGQPTFIGVRYPRPDFLPVDNFEEYLESQQFNPHSTIRTKVLEDGRLVQWCVAVGDKYYKYLTGDD